MKTLRFQLLLLLIWMYLLCRGDAQPLAITPGARRTAVVVMLVLIVAPWLTRPRWGWTLAWSVAVLWGVKYAQGDAWLNHDLPQSLREIGVMLVSTVLACGVTRRLLEFQEAVSRVLFHGLGHRPRKFGRAQAQLARELRRARLGGQPLTLLAVAVEPPDGAATRHPLLEEAVQVLAQEYVHCRVAEFLRAASRHCDSVAARNSHLIATLFAVGGEEAANLVVSLQQRAWEQLGVRLTIGSASFPDEEVTLVGLLQRAEAEVRRGRPFAAPLASQAGERARRNGKRDDEDRNSDAPARASLPWNPGDAAGAGEEAAPTRKTPRGGETSDSTAAG